MSVNIYLTPARSLSGLSASLVADHARICVLFFAAACSCAVFAPFLLAPQRMAVPDVNAGADECLIIIIIVIIVSVLIYCIYVRCDPGFVIPSTFHAVCIFETLVMHQCIVMRTNCH